MIFILFGKPGSGKGTQSKVLSERLKIRHIDVGNILRHNIQNRTELGRKVYGYIDKGNLAPDELINAMAVDTVKEVGPSSFVLDGYPRNIKQAEFFNNHILKKKNDHCIVIHLNVSDDVAKQHILDRHRGDDTEDIFVNRMKIYQQDTLPVLEFFAKIHPVLSVPAEKNIEDVSKSFMSFLYGY
jgi:adenylate kinase